MTTLYSIFRSVGSGALQFLPVPPYLDKSHISVFVNQVLTTDFTWVNSGTISLTAPSGAAIQVKRSTSPDTRLVDYQGAVPLTEADLDLDSLQAFFLAQEAKDVYADILGFAGAPLDTAVNAAVQANASAASAASNAAIIAAATNDLSSTGIGKGSKLIAFVQRMTGAVGRWVEDKLSDTVHVFDFMTPAQVADVKARTLAIDVTTPIQNALNTGRAVRLGHGSHRFSATLNLTAHGQILKGDGASTFAANPPTSLDWYGAAGGKMISFGATTPGYSNGALKDFRMNGNNLANVGVDVTSGYATYRIKLENIYVEFVNNGTAATGIALGLGVFPSFGNDIVVSNCYLGGCTIGMSGAGSTYQVSNTTFLGCPTGMKINPGAFFTLNQCVFSGGAVQIDNTSAQMVSVFGTWMENSTTAAYRATTSHSLKITGSFLHTFSTSCLMDMGNAAGNFSLPGNFIPGNSSSRLVTNINPDSEYSAVGSNLVFQNGLSQRIQGYARADQGSFAAGLSSDWANATGGGATCSLNSVPWVEHYDRQSAFNASTGVYTAQVAGDHTFSLNLSIGNISAAMTNVQVGVVIGGQTFEVARLNAAAARTASNELTLGGAVTTYMTVGQTAFGSVVITGGANVATIQSGGPGGASWRTRFAGRLAS